METRYCKDCRQTKELNDINFEKKSNGVDYYLKCYKCLERLRKFRRNRTEEQIEEDRMATRLWIQNNKEQHTISKKKWKKNNPDKVKQSNIIAHENRKCEEHNKMICLVCITHRKPGLRTRLRNRMYDAFKNMDYKWNVKKFDEYLGCSIDEFIKYIEPLMKERNFTWEDYGDNNEDWELDHIKPLIPQDSINYEEFIKRLHYTNIQPLTVSENCSKKNSE